MKHIKAFSDLNEQNILQNKMIPIFTDHPDWKLNDSWDGNGGEINFVFTNGPFEVIAEFWDPDETYTVGFRETGDKYLVPGPKRYQAGNLKNMEEVKTEMSKMMDFLEEYSK